MKLRDLLNLIEDGERISIDTEDELITFYLNEPDEDVSTVYGDYVVKSVHYSIAFNSIWIKCEEVVA